MRQMAFILSLCALVISIEIPTESWAQDNLDELMKELDEDLGPGAEIDDDNPAQWFDLSLQRMPETASFAFSLRYKDVPAPAPDHITVRWASESVDVPLKAGSDGTFSAGLIRLRPATLDARVGSIDASHPNYTTVFLPVETRTVAILMRDSQWDFGFVLNQFIEKKPTPVINDIIVVGNQTALAYPFNSDGSDGGPDVAKTRHLIVMGENLREALNTADGIGSPPKSIVYSVNPSSLSDSDVSLILARTATAGLLFHAKAAKEPHQALIAKLEARREGLASADDLISIDVTLKSGVTPGTKPLLIGEAQGFWPLLFGTQEATLQFVRHDDFVRGDSVPIFYPGDIGAVDLIFKANIPYDSIGVRILRRPATAKEGEDATEVGVVLALRLDGSRDDGAPVFRSDPIHFVSKEWPLRRPPESDDALYVNVLKGDEIGARLLDPARAKTQPSAVIAEIYGDPSELGELWKDVLKRVAKCDGDNFDGDPKYALKKSTSFSRFIVTELATYGDPLAYVLAELFGFEGPKYFGRSVTLYKGDHAAALLIRDELVKTLSPLMQTFLPLVTNFNGEVTAFRKWALESGQAGSLPMISRFKTSLWFYRLPTGKLVLLMTPPPGLLGLSLGPPINKWVNQPLTVFIDGREEILQLFGSDPIIIDTWLDKQIHAAAVAQSDGLELAIGHAIEARDCKLLEMIVIAGQKAGPVVARIVPRLLKKKISGPLIPPTMYWAPDKLARGYVERMHIMAEAVAALDQYSKIDDAYKAMALAVATAGTAAYISAYGAAHAAAAGVLIVGDVADAAYFGAKGLESAIESEAFYEFAAGASLILGDELLLEAEAQRESVGMALVGLIAPGIGAGFGLKELRHFKNINKGKAILKTKGASVLDDLDSLSPLERAQVSAYLNDMLSKTKTVDIDGLDEIDRAAMDSLYRLTFPEPKLLDSAGAAGKPGFQEARTELYTLVELKALREAVPDNIARIRDIVRPRLRDSKVLPGQFINDVNSPFAREVDVSLIAQDPSGGIIVKADGKGKLLSGSSITDPQGRVVAILDKRLGSGGGSTVFIDPDNKDLVIRISSLEGKYGDGFALDDIVGRRILEEAESPDGFFRVTKRNPDDAPFIVIDQGNPPKRYLVSREQNIASNVGGEMVSNAAARFKDRAPTLAERMTMALAIRNLNQKGIFWSDHKLTNFDIVKADTPTGYRMILFDTGGFNPMKGGSDQLRWRNARIFQRLYDRTPAGQIVDRANALQIYRAIDLRAAGGQGDFLYTPGANIDRTEYLEFNKMTPAEFRTALDSLSQLIGRGPIPYAPPGG